MPFNLKYVFCKSENLFFSLSSKYCFGKLSLDKGQSLVPLPPERITGINSKFEFKPLLELVNIIFYFYYLSFLTENIVFVNKKYFDYEIILISKIN